MLLLHHIQYVRRVIIQQQQTLQNPHRYHFNNTLIQPTTTTRLLPRDTALICPSIRFVYQTLRDPLDRKVKGRRDGITYILEDGGWCFLHIRDRSIELPSYLNRSTNFVQSAYALLQLEKLPNCKESSIAVHQHHTHFFIEQNATTVHCFWGKVPWQLLLFQNRPRKDYIP